MMVPAVMAAPAYHHHRSMGKLEWIFCGLFLFSGLGLLIWGLLGKIGVMILIGGILLGIGAVYFLARMTGACDNIQCMICLGPGDCEACCGCFEDLAS